MSFTRGSAAKTRLAVLLALGFALLPATTAQAVVQQAEARPQARKMDAPSTDRARREAQEKLLERLDSLRWEFENERMSEQERAELRTELQRAFRALDESMAQMHDGQMAMAREAARAARAAQAWSGSPDVRVTLRRLRPTGYLGLSFDGMNSEEVRDGERFIRFYQYPAIALVEPSSPADRAGVRKGDTLLALNGTDVVKNEVPLSRMLVPDARVTVRLRRGGDTKNLALVVGLAPDYVMRRWTPPTMTMATPMAPAAPRIAEMPEPVATPAPPAPATAPAMVWVFSGGMGGARMETITEGLGKALGVTGGVLVMSATTGTPAYEDGLRDGDVIVRAAGKPVASVRDLRSVMNSGDSDEGVKVVILRERKQRELTLRW